MRTRPPDRIWDLGSLAAAERVSEKKREFRGPTRGKAEGKCPLSVTA